MVGPNTKKAMDSINGKVGMGMAGAAGASYVALMAANKVGTAALGGLISAEKKDNRTAYYVFALFAVAALAVFTYLGNVPYVLFALLSAILYLALHAVSRLTKLASKCALPVARPGNYAKAYFYAALVFGAYLYFFPPGKTSAEWVFWLHLAGFIAIAEFLFNFAIKATVAEIHSEAFNGKDISVTDLTNEVYKEAGISKFVNIPLAATCIVISLICLGIANGF